MVARRAHIHSRYEPRDARRRASRISPPARLPIAEIPCGLRLLTHLVATPDEPPCETLDRPMRDYAAATGVSGYRGGSDAPPR